MRISDWSSDVCSSDLGDVEGNVQKIIDAAAHARDELHADLLATPELSLIGYPPDDLLLRSAMPRVIEDGVRRLLDEVRGISVVVGLPRSEEHTSELQSLMRISDAVFCLNKKTHTKK